MEMSSENRWNKLFAARTTVFPPEPWLADHIALLKKGSVLDLGAGDGRNSRLLAEQGYKVTAVDYSEEGLNIIARYENGAIKTIKADCNNRETLLALGQFDSVVLSHFVPDSEAMTALPHIVNHRGTVLMAAFAPPMKKLRDFSTNLILDFDELEKTLPTLSYLKKKSWRDERGFFNGCVFQFL